MTTGTTRAEPGSNRWMGFLVGLWALFAIGRILATSTHWHIGGDNPLGFGLISLRHDLLWLAGAIGLALLAQARHRIVAAIGVGLFALWWTLFAIDVIAVARFGEHVSVDGLLNNLRTRGQQWSELTMVWRVAVAATVLLILLGVWFALWRLWRSQPPSHRIPPLAMVFLATGMSVIPHAMTHPQPHTYLNWFEASAPRGWQQADSISPATFEPLPACRFTRRSNVIVVLVPDWSWAHTDRLDGGLSLTPAIDQLMDEYSWWSNYLANGFAPEHQLIAMLAARNPLPSTDKANPLPLEHYQQPRTVPELLQQAGYRSSFFSARELSPRLANWLQSIGFDLVSAAEGGAASTALTLARMLRWLGSDHPMSEPFFAVIETESLLFTAAGEKRNLVTTAKALDDALAEFYRTLRRTGYFADHQLLIASANRAREPLRKIEARQLGDNAAWRIPMLWISDEFAIEQRNDTLSQAKDLGAAISTLLGARDCVQPESGDWFNRAPRDVLSVSGDPPGRVIVNHTNGRGEILLDGAWTRVSAGELRASERLIQRIRRERSALETDG